MNSFYLKKIIQKQTIQKQNQIKSIDLNYIFSNKNPTYNLQMQQEMNLNYCQHFQHFKPTRKITIQSKPFCKFCLSTNCSLWLCLHKNCEIIVCNKSNFMHLASHMQESKKTKSFHSIFININTAEIRCQYCCIEILDIDKLNQDQKKTVILNSQSNSPLKFRTAILPFLQDLSQPKIQGQLQYPEGHRKINKGLVGIFADRENYSVIPAIQFIAHCDFFKEIILTMKVKENQNSKIFPILDQFKTIVKSIQNAYERAIRIDKFMELMIIRQPKLIGYSRKDPFESILDILNILHEHLNYYKIKNVLSNLGKDQWDLYYKPKQIESHCPIYDSLNSTLCMNFKCKMCNFEEISNHQISFVMLDFPKKRKKAKVVEQQLNEKGYESPRKRGKSLMSFILPEQDLPITIPELLIDFFKQLSHKEKLCPKCKNQEITMKPGKVQFKKIADILMLQINRLPKGTDQLNETPVLLNFDNINLSPFLTQSNETDTKIRKDPVSSQQEESEKSKNYQFVTAVGIEKGMFPVVCRSKYNNQLYVLKNECVEMLTKKNKINPYIICLKRVNSPKTTQFYQQIMRQNEIIAESFIIQPHQKIQQKSPKQQPFTKVTLPDFYHLQLKHGIQLPVNQPTVCKHNKIKPFTERKCSQQISITQKMYQHLIQTFSGTQFVSEQCHQCKDQVALINERKCREKQLIKECDLQKTTCNVMIGMSWLKKWSNYLYSTHSPSYFHKGYPFPPPIDNTVLFDNTNIKCKSNLIKNKDFKVVNIFVFRLLKELYSGGPEIRYRWKGSQLGQVEEDRIREIKKQAEELKAIYFVNHDHKSPNKSVILEKNSMETVNQTEMEDDFELQQKDGNN